MPPVLVQWGVQSERGGIGRHNRLKICRLRGVGVQVPPLVPKMIYYDRKGYENLRDLVLWLEKKWKGARNMTVIKFLVITLAAIAIIHYIWSD